MGPPQVGFGGSRERHDLNVGVAFEFRFRREARFHRRRPCVVALHTKEPPGTSVVDEKEVRHDSILTVGTDVPHCAHVEALELFRQRPQGGKTARHPLPKLRKLGGVGPNMLGLLEGRDGVSNRERSFD